MSIQLAVIAVAFGVLGVFGPGASYLLLWPALTFGAAAVAYALGAAMVFGKRSDGRLKPVHVALFLPYLGLTWLTWWLARALDQAPPWAKLTDALYIGRRPLAAEVPTDARSVVDLTAEFSEQPGVIRGRTYLARPTLDATAVPADQLWALALEIQALPGPVYLHCAQGHGRTAMVAAAVLIAAGQADRVQSALTQVRAVRNAARPNAAQVRALKVMLDLPLQEKKHVGDVEGTPVATCITETEHRTLSGNRIALRSQHLAIGLASLTFAWAVAWIAIEYLVPHSEGGRVGFPVLAAANIGLAAWWFHLRGSGALGIVAAATVTLATLQVPLLFLRTTDWVRSLSDGHMAKQRLIIDGMYVAFALLGAMSVAAIVVLPIRAAEYRARRQAVNR